MWFNDFGCDMLIKNVSTYVIVPNVNPINQVPVVIK